MNRTALLLVLFLSACTTIRQSVTPIGTANKSSDFETYQLRRVGLMLPEGDDVDPDFLRALRDALASEFTAATGYEIVPMGAADVEAVDRLEPARTGRIRPAPVLALARRSSLDAVITTRVMELRSYAPVRLVLGIDLIAVETGLVTWSGSVRVDTSDSGTRSAIESWHAALRGAGDSERALDMLSPMRIAEFAAVQAALLLQGQPGRASAGGPASVRGT
jgi:hypothetical protein